MVSQRLNAVRPWLIFIGCCVLSFVGFGMVVNTRGLYYQPLSEALGVPRAAFALTSSLSTLASIVGLIFAGRILKKVDSRLLLSICMGLLSISFVIASFGN